MNLELLDVLKTKYGVTGLRHLGDGGFGVVYSGNVFEVPRAIKVSRVVLNEKLLAMANQELEFMQQRAIKACPTIVQLIAVWRELGHLITVWDLGEQSLAARLADCRRQGLSGLPFEELERHLRDAASALDVINGLGIRHRDIKPDNIILMDGRAKITDLGLAVFVGASSLSKTASGTMGYIAPEAYGDEEQGHGRLTGTVDIYALAATAIKLATGRDPFGTNPRDIIKNQEAGQPDTTGLTEAQAAAALSALHPDPKQRRFQTAMEFYTAFAGPTNVVVDRELTLPPFGPSNEWAKSLVERGIARANENDISGAIAYFTAVIDLPNAPVDQKAWALVNRGFRSGQQNDAAGEIADYTALIKLTDAPVEWKAKAFLNRGTTRAEQNDPAGAFADFTAVIELPDAPVEWKAQALFNRGLVRNQQNDTARAIEDYTAVIELPEAPVECRARALFNRSVIRNQQNDTARAIEDCTEVIDLPDAPAEERAMAFYNRGRVRAHQNDLVGAIADCTAVIKLECSSPIVNAAWNNLGWTMCRLRHTDTRTIDIAGELLDLYAVAKRIAVLEPSDPAYLHTAGCCYASLGLWDEALESADIFLGTDGVLPESISEADLVEFFDHFVTPETVTRALTLLDKKGFRNRLPTLIERYAAFQPGSAVQNN